MGPPRSVQGNPLLPTNTSLSKFYDSGGNEGRSSIGVPAAVRGRWTLLSERKNSFQEKGSHFCSQVAALRKEEVGGAVFKKEN